MGEGGELLLYCFGGTLGDRGITRYLVSRSQYTRPLGQDIPNPSVSIYVTLARRVCRYGGVILGGEAREGGEKSAGSLFSVWESCDFEKC